MQKDLSKINFKSISNLFQLALRQPIHAPYLRVLLAFQVLVNFKWIFYSILILLLILGIIMQILCHYITKA
jgi:hypothetical protein